MHESVPSSNPANKKRHPPLFLVELVCEPIKRKWFCRARLRSSKKEGVRGRGNDGVNKVCRAGMVERSESFPAIFLVSQRVFFGFFYFV